MVSMEAKYHLRQIFTHIYQSVKPKHLISSQLKVSKDMLVIDGNEYLLNKNCYVVGFGKAVYEMGCEVHSILNKHIQKAIFSIPDGSLNLENSIFAGNPDIKIFQGAKDNIPDKNSLAATEEILRLVDGLISNDLLVVLISGGGSALLASPESGITLEEKIVVTRLLARAGADITELNAVRSKLSKVKGGRLAARAYPASVISLILSDVVGDPLQSIASGPTVRPDLNHSPSSILEKYSLILPPSILKAINAPSPLIDPGVFTHTKTCIIGNNLKALFAGKSFIENNSSGACSILTSSLKGPVHRVANALANFVFYTCCFISNRDTELQFRNSVRDYMKSLCITDDSFEKCLSLISQNRELFFLLGGETTVVVQGDGKGGRNMELALRFSNEMSKLLQSCDISKDFDVVLLSCGTDGIDGPTDAAGAIGYPKQSEMAKQQGLDMLQYIKNNDSYNFFKNFSSGQDLVVTGHTGTNVMDVMIIYIKKMQ